jgi:hypothetical protein
MGYAKKYEGNKRCHTKEAWAKKEREIKDAMPKKHEPKKEKEKNKDSPYFQKL